MMHLMTALVLRGLGVAGGGEGEKAQKKRKEDKTGGRHLKLPQPRQMMCVLWFI